MKYQGSQIASSIDKEYNKQKYWKDKKERMQNLQESKKADILILAEHSREPLIIEKEGK